jgi:hypothetical protein
VVAAVAVVAVDQLVLVAQVVALAAQVVAWAFWEQGQMAQVALLIQRGA